MSHVTYILSKELDISDIGKALNDLLSEFLRERLQEEKSLILKKIVSADLTEDEISQIRDRLNEVSKKLVILKSKGGRRLENG